MTQSDRCRCAGSCGLVEEIVMKSFVALALVSLPLAALAAGTFTLESA
jgi:hypothetical protein